MKLPRIPSRGELRELLREQLEDARRLLRVVWLAWRLFREFLL
jgi:hypothetical protein